MLIDDLTINIQAGKGGNGMVAFNSNKMELGPTGARGGNGGNVYFKGIADLGALNTLKNKKVFKAEDGKIGGRQLNDGPAGKDTTINIPVGTIIHNLATSEKIEIIKIGEKVLGAKGGNGGKGNFHFRGPRNTSPKQFQYGKPGEEFDIRLELKLIADVGLIGLPNSGKSSLLNELTRAKSKVANYAFTTLQPHLGVYYDLVMADIPGLIEGASAGKGLGIKFLRHVERTSILFHLVSAESKNPVEDYKSIRKELGAYNKLLLDKEEYLFLSKADVIPQAEAIKKLDKLKKLNPNASLLSIHDLETIESVQRILNKIADEKKL